MVTDSDLAELHGTSLADVPTNVNDMDDSRTLDGVRYTRILDGNRWYAIAEVELDGNETYSACEGDCGRWYPFTPTPAERRAVRRLREEGKGKRGWTACIDLDAQVEDLAWERVAAFEDFQQLVRSHIARFADWQFDQNRGEDLRLAGEVDFHVKKSRSLIRGFAQWLRRNEVLMEALVNGHVEVVRPDEAGLAVRAAGGEGRDGHCGGILGTDGQEHAGRRSARLPSVCR